MPQEALFVDGETSDVRERAADIAFHDAEALHALTRRDPISGLYNRKQFVDDFGFGVSSDSHGASDVVVLMTLMAADQYNGILRALGHSFSEEVVRLGANRLRKLLPKDIQIYHVSLLSFAFALPASEGERPPEMLEDLMAGFAEPLICTGIPVRNRAGFGLSRPSDMGTDPSEILRGALVAAQDSRNKIDGWAWYNRKTDQAHLRSFRLLADLGRLMEAPSADTRSQFALYYQPKVDLRTGACSGAEALMRWTHPNFGLVSPAEFVPLAEATAVITPLTRWVFRQGVAQRAKWRDAGINARISLNVSPINLAEPDFADFALDTCDEHGVDPSMVEIEFTESAQTMNSDLTLAQLAHLRTAGVKVAIDDFGSGYSNMRYLRSIPADALKIDKDFIMTLDTDSKNQKIVPTIIDLGHRLGFDVIAEGIENEASFDRLVACGCDHGQGYHMSKPLTEPDFRDWFAACSSRAA